MRLSYAEMLLTADQCNVNTCITNDLGCSSFTQPRPTFTNWTTYLATSMMTPFLGPVGVGTDGPSVNFCWTYTVNCTSAIVASRIATNLCPVGLSGAVYTTYRSTSLTECGQSIALMANSSYPYTSASTCNTSGCNAPPAQASSSLGAARSISVLVAVTAAFAFAL